MQLEANVPYLCSATETLRAKNTRARISAALGLHIVDQLVTAHEGKLTFIDEGKGLTVRVELPLSNESDEDPS